MAFYKIEWKQSARRELKKLPKKVITKIVESVEKLATEPLPVDSRKLSGSNFTYRIRVGDYRIVYSVYSSALVIEIIRVGHRKDVYRGL